MNYIDIIFIAIVALLTFSGLKYGIIRAIGGILGIFVGIYVAVNFYPNTSNWLTSTFSFLSQSVANILAFIFLFIIANRIFALLVFFIDKIFSVPILGFFNKLFGGILGLIAGFILVSIILSILAYFDIGADILANSKVTPYADKVFSVIRPILPQDLKDISISGFLNNDWIDKLNEALDNLPKDINSVDKLSTYLKDKVGLSDNLISQITESQFQNASNLSTEEIKSKLQEYINNK